MIVKNKYHPESMEVIGIQFYSKRDYLFASRMTFYVLQQDMIGVGVEKFEDIEVIQSDIGRDFRFHLIDDGGGAMILWKHFSDVQHFARLIDLDEEVLAEFEVARHALKLGGGHCL
jgi:hypothetical protein